MRSNRARRKTLLDKPAVTPGEDRDAEAEVMALEHVYGVRSNGECADRSAFGRLKIGDRKGVYI
ncbi:MAG: hypothetical protein MPJ50_18610 [Pirellulales bacterium]|nr:hypothetical protein [Pirellulales bacterium]